jgi:hypothetical protein
MRCIACKPLRFPFYSFFTVGRYSLVLAEYIQPADIQRYSAKIAAACRRVFALKMNGVFYKQLLKIQ